MISIEVRICKKERYRFHKDGFAHIISLAKHFSQIFQQDFRMIRL